LDHSWTKTCDNAGEGVDSDPRAGATLGGYPVLKHIDQKGRRSYAATGYYAPIAGRENLTLLTGVHVSKIIFEKVVDGTDAKASGVEFVTGGQTFVVSARDEVLLCAGTVQSPQILELSGIGSQQVLASQGVEVIIENPNVGENLQVRQSFLQPLPGCG
jgi:choline dehydrogenase-like flavoprotein